MSIAIDLQRIEDAGFTLEVDGADIIINPPGKLTPEQRGYLAKHKAEIISALKSRVLQSSDAGAAFMSGYLDQLKKKEMCGGVVLGKDGKSPSALSAGTPPPSHKVFSSDNQGVSPKPNQAQVLPPSPAGNDISPANQIPVEAHTPAGARMTVYAADQDQVEWIKAHNKPCQKSKPVAPSELPQVANPGLPSDLHMLATRYCAEVYGDGPEAIAAMLDDLMTAPDDWHFWKADFIRKLSIPDQARCCDCQHSEFVHGGLGRCLRGIQSPGAGGWWLTDQHHCLGFTARLQPQIPECPGISGWRFANDNEELK